MTPAATKSFKGAALRFAGTLALMIGFTLLWDRVSEPIEHARARIAIPILAALIYNCAHAGAHQALHTGVHRLIHLCHKFIGRTKSEHL